jgi:hypothetical protein
VGGPEDHVVGTELLTDLSSVRASDTNTLLRLYDKVRVVRHAAPRREVGRRAQRHYNRVVSELRKRGIRV